MLWFGDGDGDDIGDDDDGYRKITQRFSFYITVLVLEDFCLKGIRKSLEKNYRTT